MTAPVPPQTAVCARPGCANPLPAGAAPKTPGRRYWAARRYCSYACALAARRERVAEATAAEAEARP